MGTRRDHFLKIRYSDDEWARLHARFPRGTLGTDVRKLSLSQPAPKIGAAQATRKEYILALAQIGHDLNQTKRRQSGKRRGYRVTTRFSDDEWAVVRTTFPKGGVSTAMRGLALGEPVPHRSPVLEVRHDLLLAISRLGNNLNQIAKGINQANLAGKRVDPIRVLAKLVEIQDALECL
jgi:hypothetical protein